MALFACQARGVPLTGESWNQLLQEISDLANLFRDEDTANTAA